MQYECKDCANQATALCEKCLFVTKPSGDTDKPTGFVQLKNIPLCATRKEYIAKCLEENAPIPIKVVLGYNKEV